MTQIGSKNIYSLLDEDYVEAKVEAKVAPASETPSTKPKSARTDQKKPRSDNRNKSTVKKGDFMGKPEYEETKAPRPHKHQKPNHGRPFDRKSQAGNVKSGEKKEVAGWGNEVSAQIEASTEVVEDVEEELKVEKEPEENFKSFEDFLKEKQASRLAPTTTTRAPNDGVEDAKWNKMTLVTKNEEVLFAGKAANKEKKVKEVKQKTTLIIEQKFAPKEKNIRLNNSRNNQKEVKANRPSERRPKAPAVNVNDKKAFPSLSGN